MTFGVLVLSATSLLACGGSVDDDASATDRGGAAGDGGHGGSASGNGSPGAGGGGGAAGDVDGGEPAVACGARAGDTCAGDEYCDFPDALCGAADGEGVCKKRPSGCDGNYSPVCGCDGKVRGNECEAHAAGTDVSVLGACEAPAGFIPCGATFCDARHSYCAHFVSDVGGEPDSFECLTLPASCNGAGTCECLADEGCGPWCEAIEGGDGAAGAKLTCPGG